MTAVLRHPFWLSRIAFLLAIEFTDRPEHDSVVAKINARLFTV